MSFNRKNNHKTLVAAVLIPLFAVAGCGTDEDTLVKKDDPTSTIAKTETAPVVAQTPPETTRPAPEPVGEVTYEIAERAFLDGRYDEAVGLFTRYTERTPNNPWGHYMLGLSAWKDGQLETAEKSFNQSLALDPNHLKSCTNLARVLLESRRASEAITRLDRALEIDPASSTAYRLKGRAYHDLNQVDDAIVAYQGAIALDPTDAWSMNNLGFVLIQQGRYEDALPALARATELRKDVAVFYNNLGMALEHTGHFATATEAYALSLSLDAANGRAALNHDRVSGVREDPATGPVDLAALARAFEDTIGEWKVSSVTTSAPTDSVLSVQPE